MIRVEQSNNEMSIEKPSLLDTFVANGDIRCTIDLITKYDYTNEEASEVINVYEPYKNCCIPEVEHIETILHHFPKARISDDTMDAIKQSFPNRVEYILKLQNAVLKQHNNNCH